MRLEEYLQGTQFELELAKALHKFIPQHMQASLDNSEINYREYGTEREVRLKNILHYFTSFYTVLNDLELTFEFFKKERKLILEHYPNLKYQETYYNYHFENYFIRIATLNDILGKLGTLVYELNLDLKKSYSYIFKDKARKEGYEEISQITEKLISKLEQFKQQRHDKLHTGKADIQPLNGVVIWDDLTSILSSEVDEILQEHNDNEIEAEIEKLRTGTIEIINIIKEFLEVATEKLKELIDS